MTRTAVRSLCFFLFLLVPALCWGQSAPLTITTQSMPQGTVGQNYNFQFQATGGFMPYSWSISGLPPNLVGSTSGAVTGVPQSVGVSTVNVTLRDAQGQSNSRQFSLTIVQPSPLTITTTTLPNGMPNQPYSAQVNASGGQPPYYFYFDETSNIPPGLSISESGLISGIPTQIGSYRVTVVVYDTNEDSVTRRYTIIIGDPLRFLTPVDLPPATAGMGYFQTINATGGVPPYTFSFSDLPPQGFTLTAGGILEGTPNTAGTLPVPIQVADSQGTIAEQVFLLRVIGQPPVLQPSEISLDFVALVGGDAPPSQSVAIIPTDGRVRNYAVTLESGSGAPAGVRAAAPPWLSATPDDGQIPTRISVAVDQLGLSSGNYPARILVNTPGESTREPIVVNVNLRVQAQAPRLEVSPTLLRFAARQGGPSRLQQVLALRNAGGGAAIPFTVSIAGGSRWLSVSPASGQTQRGVAVPVAVIADITGLPVGQHRDVIRISWAGGVIEVPVVLFLSEPGPQLDLNVKGVTFRTRQGGSLATTRLVRVLNRGTGSFTFNAEVTRGTEWLAVSQSSSPVTPSASGTVTLRLLPAVANMGPGAYYALVRVTAGGALGSPQYLVAVLQVQPASAPTLLDFEPAGVVFVLPPGSGTQSAIFRVSATSQTPVAFQAAASTLDGEGWLSVSPPSGTAAGDQTTDVTITVRAAGLAPRVYRGEVDLARGNVVRTINVTLIIAEAVASPAALPVRAADCVPASLAVTQTGLPNHFSVPAGWPATVIVNLRDNCGRAVQEASVIASFSNGDPPLSLNGDGTGSYSATWQPGAAGKQVNMTVRATASGLSMGTSLIIGDVTENNVPILARNGTIHNLNPKLGGPLSPGVVASVFGSGLASVTESTGQVPLLTAYKGTSVIVGPFDVPLYFVSPGQVNVQLPSELTANRQYSIVVAANNALTLPDTVDVVPVQPGVAAFQDGRLIAQHADFTLVDEARPARRGELLIMYLVGLGETTPSVPSGTPSPGNPLGIPKVQPTVTIDGQPVDIVFAGLTPGGVGLFQINFYVPANARTGVPLDVVVRQGDVEANITKLTVVP
jgi:uncharacterized protein (TIGR03437 family)